jgi:hypothetical protein
MDEFSKIMSENGDAFSRMGGTADNGARSFIKISSDLNKSNLGQNLRRIKRSLLQSLIQEFKAIMLSLQTIYMLSVVNIQHQITELIFLETRSQTLLQTSMDTELTLQVSLNLFFQKLKSSPSNITTLKLPARQILMPQSRQFNTLLIITLIKMLL